MGLFNGNIKKELEEASTKIKDLEEQILLKNNNEMALSDKINNMGNEQKSLELDKKSLEIEIKRYKDLFGEEELEIQTGKEKVFVLQLQINQLNSEIDIETDKLIKIKNEFVDKQKEYIVMDQAVLLQSFGLYQPQYNFAMSSQYKERLEEVREKQSLLVKDGEAAVCLKIWSVEGSATKGKKLTEDNIKQIIRTFNIECDNIIQKVKFSNYDASKKRILKSYESLNKLNSLNKIIIQNQYIELKYQELDLAFEFAQKIQEEKEELRQQKDLRREEIKLARELEQKRLEVEKEQQHYNNAMSRLREQICSEKNEDRLTLLKEREQSILKDLEEIHAVLKDLDYRQANHRAGYVYVISNIGAFGENIYKIGMTRRLDPQDRIDELGGASVPFKFDIHAMIFSDDAPKLETALHRAFDDKKINAVNGRKEFFRVTLDQIETVVKSSHDKTVDFIKYPEAQQYRESLKLNIN